MCAVPHVGLPPANEAPFQPGRPTTLTYGYRFGMGDSLTVFGVAFTRASAVTSAQPAWRAYAKLRRCCTKREFTSEKIPCIFALRALSVSPGSENSLELPAQDRGLPLGFPA